MRLAGAERGATLVYILSRLKPLIAPGTPAYPLRAARNQQHRTNVADAPERGVRSSRIAAAGLGLLCVLVRVVLPAARHQR